MRLRNIILRQINKAFFIVSWAFLSLSTAFANDSLLEFEKGNKAFEGGDFESAILAYEGLLKKDFTSKELHYNLGNAYFKQQQLGRAILHYEKALLLAPHDKDTQFNLTVANARKMDAVSALPPFFLFSWWKTLRDLFSPGIWGMISLLMLWLTAACIVGWLFLKERQQKKMSFLGGVAGFCLTVLFLILSFSRLSYVKDSQQAILLEKENKLYSAPDPDSPEVLLVHEGLKVEILDQISDWYKVRMVNGEQGWLPVEVLGKI